MEIKIIFPKHWENEVAIGIASAQIDTARTAFNNLTHRTPVDTGTAKWSWNIQSSPDIPTPLIREIRTGYPPVPQLSKRVKSIYITNSAPYMVYLNRGYSKQAPSAFIEQALSDAYRDVPQSVGNRFGNFWSNLKIRLKKWFIFK